jgi:transcriptional regulator with XRE-family HTH domain
MAPQDSTYSKEFAEAIGRTIKVIRTDLGMERRELATRVGISYSYLTEIENGNKPASSAVLRPIAHALGLRLSELTQAAEFRFEAQAEARADALVLGALAADAQAADAQATPEPGAPGPPAQALPEYTPSQAPFNALRNAPRNAQRPDLERQLSVQPSLRAQQLSMQPSLRGQHRELREAILELERLLQRMAPDDIERLLDYARRLSR